MSISGVVAFIEECGAVLVAGHGPVPRLVDAIVREPIKGSWWGHPQSHAIYAILQELEARDDLLVCRLIGGKVTIIHHRLWPALIRMSDQFDPRQLARIYEEHTPSGKHVTREVGFPKWVPESIQKQGSSMSREEAARILFQVLPSAATTGVRRKPVAGRPPRKKSRL